MRLGWTVAWSTGSHPVLTKPGYPRISVPCMAAHFGWEPRMVAGVEVEQRDNIMHVMAAGVLA